MKKIIVTLVMSLVLVSGCASADKFLGSTTASYTPGGQLYYNSNKNQEGFKAHTTFDPKTGNLTGLDIETKATTPESAIAAALESQKAALELINKILEKALAAAGGIPK